MSSTVSGSTANDVHKTPVLAVRTTPELRYRLRAMAHAEGVSMAEICRRLLADGVRQQRDREVLAAQSWRIG
jgi:hypothetical protein